MMEDEDELMDGEVEAVGKQALELVHGKLEEVVEEVDHMVLALVCTQVEVDHMILVLVYTQVQAPPPLWVLV